MEKIKQKPIEKIKTVVIAVLTFTMLALAVLYIGGSQFSGNNAAINALDMPSGAVPAGEDAPKQTSVYEKNLLAVSFIGIRCGTLGGGAHGCETAAADLFEFACEPLHTLLSSKSTVEEITKEEFDTAAVGERYICVSFVSALPYQAVYALSGEYGAPFGSERAINPQFLLLSFDESGAAALYMRDKENYYMATGDYAVSHAELSAMASDTRLRDFEITDGVPLSDSTPLVQVLSLSEVDALYGGELQSVLSLLGYDSTPSQPSTVSGTFITVAPHGTITVGDGKVVYTASDEGGVSISSFLDLAKSELDISLYDVLLSSVTLVEELQSAAGEAGGSMLELYLDGFYQNEDVYTIIFGAAESAIPISGDAFPHLAKITVQSGKFKSIEFSLVTAERSGYQVSPFSSAWEYRYASKSAKISSMGLRYRADALPANELDAAWYCTGEGATAK